MSGKDSEDLGVAFYVAFVSALVNKPTAGGLVVLGQMSIHGVLSRIEQLGDRLRVAMDAGARQVFGVSGINSNSPQKGEKGPEFPGPAVK